MSFSAVNYYIVEGDGEHTSNLLKAEMQIKENLKDPYSYERIDYYNNSDGSITIKYRAKNSFGGYVVDSQRIYP